MKALGIFLLLVGCLWALTVLWIFLGLSAISEPVSIRTVVLYYGGLLIGPLILVAGSALVLRGTSLKLGSVLTAIGCAILTGFVLYNSFLGLQPRKPLEPKPVYGVYAVLLGIMVLADIAAYRIYRMVASMSGRMT